MHPLLIGLAVALNLVSAVLFYLSAPRQQWASQALPAKPARWAASLALAAALLLWLSQAQVATALFAVLTLTMILFAVLPYLAAWRTLRRAR
ncbi:hypothetical protein [Rugamonas aquatica]|uniref:DUF3325 domain-containing protein n=1 Tax=Rugamonas aquatica TaxID=2743357 RepID=A0A6A7MWK7_9BURK|nr:hypothetical protein [Rugamonas aquatica]MQA37018.1 hypothetical protein [Rugamonas aquatica]